MWGCHTKKLVWQPCFVVSQQKNLVMQGGGCKYHIVFSYNLNILAIR